MGRAGKITRRVFLGVGAVAAGAVAFGYYKYKKPYANPLEAAAAEGDAVFNPYVVIAEDGTVTIIAPRAEMGQGVQTTLAALVAEEMDLTLDQVSVVHGPASAAYYNEAMLVEGGPFPVFDEGWMAEMTRSTMRIMSKFLALQVTGGSSATVDAFVKMREAGAAARIMLVEAAAAEWGVAADGLVTADGQVTDPASGQSLGYGPLAQAAVALAPPADVPLRPRADWKLLGQSQPRVDLREKVTGAPIFGIDVELPDMLHGTVKMSPRFWAGAASVDDSAALAVPGVRAVVPIETTTGRGFGIIADNTWAAFQGAEALDVTWEDAAYPADTEGQRAALDAAFAADPSFSLGGSGDAEAALGAAAEVIEAEYEVPYLAHATMEPMNATAQITDGKLEIWTGTQAPGIVQMACAGLLGIESEDVTVYTTRLGGGFGRRGEVDFPLYAAALARETGGRPIKVTWTREEDTRHDTYRPMAKARYRGALGEDGTLAAMEVRVASPSILKSVMARTFPSLSAGGPEKIVLEGAFDQPVTVPDSAYHAHLADLDIPVGFWRSVGNSFNGFFHESFLDEAARAAGKDPLDFRLAMMGDPAHAPARAVLERVADMSGWGGPAVPGRGRGIAHTLSFGTWVAQVVEVEMQDEAVKIDRVWCAADCGLVLDPQNVQAQMMSGIVFGLSQALGQEITFVDGEVEQGNFYDFDAMRMHQCPEIEVALLETAPKMGGAGEPGTPPAPAALANAIFDATGLRIRRMPLSHEIDFV
ncbi:xanthine dehydrogenase family protein molybdopterin-binding subunit [Oceanomicrobium pacificus]|uniref:Molybdopterin-dependent oxidoreductase n=1 Tax=Oceanomicrobium pacificus TaxID=2692916 RepID=A0A6B0TKZ3_9RHOB|nr:molybdopterin cofactor-binding domain-containing protein [Oceanomicrobium pacificus]MXU64536.1 molybdopterin-dependent oxidoreductase [Oceanomicrobium pacificus]